VSEKANSDESWQTRLITHGDPRMSQSLEIGLMILQGFSPAQQWMGIAEIADEFKLSRPTTHRYVKTLQALGFVEQGVKRKYRLTQGARYFGAAMLNATGLPNVSFPFLQALRNEVRYTVSLAILDRDSILYAGRVYGHSRGQYTADEGRLMGSRVPASCTALGKALVAGLPESDGQEWTQKTKLRSCGPNAIVRKAEFQTELELVRQRGYAVNNEELVRGMVAIAAPIQRDNDVNVAIGVAANAHTTPAAALVERCCDALLATASELAEHLDYNPRMRWRNT
jgi:IclR family transcriptional regulator, pca regulon regulatory protein